jgi:hypothetical protein
VIVPFAVEGMPVGERKLPRPCLGSGGLAAAREILPDRDRISASGRAHPNLTPRIARVMVLPDSADPSLTTIRVTVSG